MIRASAAQLNEVIQAIDSVPETQGSGLALFHHPDGQIIVRQPQGSVRSGRWVVIEEIVLPVGRSRGRTAGGAARRVRLQMESSPVSAARRLRRRVESMGPALSRALGREIVGARMGMPPFCRSLVTDDRAERLVAVSMEATLSCGGAILSGVALAGSAAAAPATGGASIVAGVIAWTGFAASSVQCGMDVTRLVAEVREPGAAAAIDRDPEYRMIRRGVDVVSFGTGVTSLAGATDDIARFARTRSFARGGGAMRLPGRGHRPPPAHPASPARAVSRPTLLNPGGSAASGLRPVSLSPVTGAMRRSRILTALRVYGPIAGAVSTYVGVATSSVTHRLVIHLLSNFR